jgi:hypothetical protein
MSDYAFTLQKYSGPKTRFGCPACGKRHCFTRYIDNTTGEPVGPAVGRCDRENSCGYHLRPGEHFRAEGIPYTSSPRPIPKKEKTKPISYIRPSLLESSRKAFQRNHFAVFLTGLLGKVKARELIDRYLVGTSKYWPGATVFWQVDREGKVRTGKIMLYDAVTGKRVKKPQSKIQWAHRFSNDPHFRLSQCLFGEHLLQGEPGKPVAIVESEKTAIIASAYYPQYLWLACGGISQLSLDRCLPLKGRDVTLIPDVDAFQVWQERARRLEDGLLQRIKVTEVLIGMASEKEMEAGWDIADFLMEGRIGMIESASMTEPRNATLIS